MSRPIQIEPTTSDRLGAGGAILPGTTNENRIEFPKETGTVSLGKSQIASGIITMSLSALTGSATVTGLTSSDVVLTSVDTDMYTFTDGTGSFGFNVNTTTGVIKMSAVNSQFTGSYAHGHYVVLRTLTT